MKSLEQVSRNFELKSEPDNKKHLLEDIPEQAKELVNIVIKTMKSNYPAWRYSWATDNDLMDFKQQLTLAMLENDVVNKSQIQNGLRQMRSTQSSFLPSIGEFISWCLTPEPIADIELQKLMRDCISWNSASKFSVGSFKPPSKLVAEVTKKIDWWYVNNNNANEALKHLKVVYGQVIAKGFVDEDQPIEQRLETHGAVKARFTEEQIKASVDRNVNTDEMKSLKKRLRSINARSH